MLHGALLKMIENLIAYRSAAAAKPARLLEIGLIEVAYSPRQNLAFALELPKGLNRVLQRVAVSAPVQKVAVQPLC